MDPGGLDTTYRADRFQVSAGQDTGAQNRHGLRRGIGQQVGGKCGGGRGPHCGQGGAFQHGDGNAGLRIDDQNRCLDSCQAVLFVAIEDRGDLDGNHGILCVIQEAGHDQADAILLGNPQMRSQWSVDLASVQSGKCATTGFDGGRHWQAAQDILAIEDSHS